MPSYQDMYGLPCRFNNPSARTYRKQHTNLGERVSWWIPLIGVGFSLTQCGTIAVSYRTCHMFWKFSFCEHNLCHTFKIHQQRCKTHRRQHAFSVRRGPVLEQVTGADCERAIRGDIQVATECTVAVPLPRSSPLTHPPIFHPEFVPPCRIPLLCYCGNYSWSTIVVFPAH